MHIRIILAILTLISMATGKQTYGAYDSNSKIREQEEKIKIEAIREINLSVYPNSNTNLAPIRIKALKKRYINRLIITPQAFIDQEAKKKGVDPKIVIKELFLKDIKSLKQNTGVNISAEQLKKLWEEIETETEKIKAILNGDPCCPSCTIQ